MTKRTRRRPYWVFRRDMAHRFARVFLPRYGVLIRYRRKRPKRARPRRELVARPKPVRSNKRLYCRSAEHARQTFGRLTGLTWEWE